MQLLTHSRLACFRACPRRHYLRFELGLTPVETGFAMRVGSAFHAALDAADRGMDPEAAIGAAVIDPYDLALIAAMFQGHQARYASQPLEPIASEQEFELPLRNPETGAATPIWKLAGKMDRLVRMADGCLALMEYKTTSRDFSPGSDYWQRLRRDQQLSIYVIAARRLGYQVETTLYDVTRRPSLRPLKATPEAARKFTKDGRLYATQRDRDERPEEFAARVAADIASRPDYYFARIDIARLEQDLDDCGAELWMEQLAIREAQRSGRWYRNPDACCGVVPCDFIAICDFRDLETRTPDGFQRTEDQHPELSGDAVLAG